MTELQQAVGNLKAAMVETAPAGFEVPVNCDAATLINRAADLIRDLGGEVEADWYGRLNL